MEERGRALKGQEVLPIYVRKVHMGHGKRPFGCETMPSLRRKELRFPSHGTGDLHVQIVHMPY